MATLFGLYPFLLKLYADGGYQGWQFQAALRRIFSPLNIEIVKRSDAAKTCKVLPKRWIVERTIGWLNRCRRLAKDGECSPGVFVARRSGVTFASRLTAFD